MASVGSSSEDLMEDKYMCDIDPQVSQRMQVYFDKHI